MRMEKHWYLHRLEDLGAHLTCPSCSKNIWDMMIEDPVRLDDQRLMEFALVRSGGRLAIDVVVMVCRGCGLVRMHSAEKILELAGQKTPAQGEG